MSWWSRIFGKPAPLASYPVLCGHEAGKHARIYERQEWPVRVNVGTRNGTEHAIAMAYDGERWLWLTEWDERVDAWEDPPDGFTPGAAYPLPTFEILWGSDRVP